MNLLIREIHDIGRICGHPFYFEAGSKIYSNKRKLNPCRPGYGASCALCCGSHNYRLPPEEIHTIFEERNRSVDDPFFYGSHPEDALHEKLIDSAMQCPFVAADGSDPGVIGCLIYYDSGMSNNISSFVTKTCRVFLCPAWECLTDEEIIFAARLTRDWYYYGLLLNDIEALKELSSTYGRPEEIPADVLEELKISLEERFIEEDGK